MVTVTSWLVVVVFINCIEHPLYGQNLNIQTEQQHVTIEDFQKTSVGTKKHSLRGSMKSKNSEDNGDYKYINSEEHVVKLKQGDTSNQDLDRPSLKDNRIEKKVKIKGDQENKGKYKDREMSIDKKQKQEMKGKGSSEDVYKYQDRCKEDKKTKNDEDKEKDREKHSKTKKDETREKLKKSKKKTKDKEATKGGSGGKEGKISGDVNEGNCNDSDEDNKKNTDNDLDKEKDKDVEKVKDKKKKEAVKDKKKKKNKSMGEREKKDKYKDKDNKEVTKGGSKGKEGKISGDINEGNSNDNDEDIKKNTDNDLDKEKDKDVEKVKDKKKKEAGKDKKKKKDKSKEEREKKDKDKDKDKKHKQENKGKWDSENADKDHDKDEKVKKIKKGDNGEKVNKDNTKKKEDKIIKQEKKTNKAEKKAAKIANKIKMWPLEKVKHWNTPMQSPVDLITAKAKNMSNDLPLLEIINHDVAGVKATIYNSGYTVHVYIDEEPELRPCLIGGPLRYKFVFEQMHFHWGSNNIWGSEHFIDGEGFSVEIQMVYYNHYKYKQFKKAAQEKNGLAVMTVFAEATHDKDDKLFNPLYKQLPKIKNAGSKTELGAEIAMQWVRSAMKTNTKYFAYPGSLTSPPYSENVLFILLPKPILLSKHQLNAFRTLHKFHHDKTKGTNFDEFIMKNKRNLQPLHGRPIITSSKLN